MDGVSQDTLGVLWADGCSVGLDVVWDIEMVCYNESSDPKDHPPSAYGPHRFRAAGGKGGVAVSTTMPIRNSPGRIS